MAETPTEPAVGHIEHWRRIVDRRRLQMEAAYERAAMASGDYWGKRATTYRAALHQHSLEDPLVRRLFAATSRSTTLIDVGAGTGRHTLALAPRISRVVAVDPSEAMLSHLRQDLLEADISNVQVVVANWLDADVQPSEMVICSHVLYPIVDVVPFLRKLDAHATERVFVYLRADPLPTDFGLWSAFHGEPLQAQPIYLDALNVLHEIGILANVEIVEHRFTWTFANLDEAMPQVRNSLCLGEGDDAQDARLRSLLRERMVPWENGRIGPKVEHARSAIISWKPTGVGAS